MAGKGDKRRQENCQRISDNWPLEKPGKQKLIEDAFVKKDHQEKIVELAEENHSLRNEITVLRYIAGLASELGERFGIEDINRLASIKLVSRQWKDRLNTRVKIENDNSDVLAALGLKHLVDSVFAATEILDSGDHRSTIAAHELRINMYGCSCIDDKTCFSAVSELREYYDTIGGVND